MWNKERRKRAEAARSSDRVIDVDQGAGKARDASGEAREAKSAVRAVASASRRAWLVVLACAVLGIAVFLIRGWRHDQQQPRPAASSTSSIYPTASPEGQAATVVAAWRRYWDVYLAASDPMNPTDSRLPEVATGDALTTVTSAFLASKSDGEVFRGTIELNPATPRVTGDSATLRDCYLSHILAYDAGTGALRDQSSGVRRLVSVSLTKEAGTWKVERIRHEGDGCTAAS